MDSGFLLVDFGFQLMDCGFLLVESGFVSTFVGSIQHNLSMILNLATSFSNSRCSLTMLCLFFQHVNAMVWRRRACLTRGFTKQLARGGGVSTARTTQVAHTAKDVVIIITEKPKTANVKLATVIPLVPRVYNVTETADVIANLE